MTPKTTITREFWMVRDEENYRLYRKNRKPIRTVHTSIWGGPRGTWRSWSNRATQVLCVRQVHRLFPGIGRMRQTDAPRRVNITMEVVE